ncbi:hypothetical protein PENOC_043140 [Penicillium occitanis (nom. inval.)]|nr:hypothetical protein PENOC_043140 [Penicillium occitanis (nom. inval.)]
MVGYSAWKFSHKYQNFVIHLQHQEHHDNFESPLHLIIIGGSLCGLSAAIATRLAGHNVTVLETVPAFREVGAGVQITSNGTRLLKAWGLSNTLSSQAAAPKYFRMRRYNGDLLADRNQYTEEIEARYGSPLWCLHRADLQVAIAEKAMELGVVIKLGCKVESVKWEDGEEARGDIVLAADGIWSETRQKLLGKDVRTQPTKDLEYRILLDRESIKDDALRAWLDSPSINIWVDPEETFTQGKEHHLPEGPEQVKRDMLPTKSFEKSTNGEKTWTRPRIQPRIYGYDAYAEVEKAYSLHPF